MATYKEILEALAGETAPVGATVIAKKLNLKVHDVATQLARMVKKSWAIKDKEGQYTISDEGKSELNPSTEENEGQTEFQQFIDFGRRIGVKEDIVTLTAEHVWRGGDYRDLVWVWKALAEQGIRSDMAKRWFNNWKTYLRQEMPVELEKELGSISIPGVAASEQKKVTPTGKRDYKIGPDGMPEYQGEGYGDMDYRDAVELSRANLIAQGRAATQQPPNTPESLSESIAKIFAAFKVIQGEQPQQKHINPMVIIPTAEGYKVQEFDPSQPLVLSNPNTPPAAPVQAATKYIMVHPDGTTQEVAAGQPIIIQQPSAPVQGAGLVNLQTPEGKPFTVDISALDTLFKIDDYNEKKKRDKESHDLKMDIASSLKELVVKGGKVLERMHEDGKA